MSWTRSRQGRWGFRVSWQLGGGGSRRFCQAGLDKERGASFVSRQLFRCWCWCSGRWLKKPRLTLIAAGNGETPNLRADLLFTRKALRCTLDMGDYLMLVTKSPANCCWAEEEVSGRGLIFPLPKSRFLTDSTFAGRSTGSYSPTWSVSKSKCANAGMGGADHLYSYLHVFLFLFLWVVISIVVWL